MSQRDDVKKQLKKQDDEFYGDQTVSGSAPDPESDDSVEDIIEEVMGEDASAKIMDPDDDGFSLADEITEDEKSLFGASEDDLEE